MVEERRALGEMKESLESKNNQIKALEERIGRFDEEMEELHEKQEKILDCLYTEKLIGEKKLRKAQGIIAEYRLKDSIFDEKNKEILDLKSTLKRLEDKLVERDGENIELKKQLSTRNCKMEQKLDQLTEFEAEEVTSEHLQELIESKELEVSKLTEELYKKESQNVRLKVKNLKICTIMKNLLTW